MDSRSLWFALAMDVIGCSAVAAEVPPAPRDAPAWHLTRASHTLSRLPLAFEINRGQTDARAEFRARVRGMEIYLTEAGAVLSLMRMPENKLPDHHAPLPDLPWVPQYLSEAIKARPSTVPESAPALALRYRFAGANPNPRVEGLDPLPGRSNYFIGSDPKQWRSDIPQYQRVRYRNMYAGVDVVYYGSREGDLEFDVEVAPSADLDAVRLRVDGADSFTLDTNGDLKIRTALGELIQHRPIVYQAIAGGRHEMRGDYLLRDVGRGGTAHEVAFHVADYDRRVALVLDPTLVTSLLVGGASADSGTGVAADSSGNWYFTGYSQHSSTNFPTTIGAYQSTNNGGFDAFIYKISNDGSTVLYSTLIGGSGNDQAYGIGVDVLGNAYIAGTTYSNNFPVKNALQGTTPNGTSGSGFVTALNAAGNGLIYSTYIGGSSASVPYTYVNGIAVDANGNAYVTGETTVNDLPTSATAFLAQPTTTGNNSAFVFKFDPNGVRVFGTYIVDDYFGFGGDHGNGIAIDDVGNAYIVGNTNSNFGGTYNGVPAVQIGPGGGTYDILLARLNRTGQWLDWVTHIGGSNLDEGTAVAVDASHQVILTGWSNSPDLPPNTAHTEDWGWVAHIDETGTQLLDSTWIGVTGVNVFPSSVAWDEVVVAGAAQNAGGGRLPALSPLANDCASSCGASNAYDAFLSFFGFDATGKLTLTSQSQVDGVGGSDTRFNGVAQAPDAVHQIAVVGKSAGTPPGTTKVGTGDDGYAAIADPAPPVTPRPPVVKKNFSRETVEPGREITMVILVYNPKSSPAPLTEFFMDDFVPACLTFDKVTFETNLVVDYAASSGRLHIGSRPNFVLLPGQAANVQIRFRASGTGVCNNVTGTATTNLGALQPATGSVNIIQNPCDAISTGACTSMNMSNTACWNGGVAPANSCDAQITPCTGGGQCNITNDQPVSQKIDTLKVDGATNITGNPIVLGGGLNVLNGVTVNIAPAIDAAAGTLDFNVASPAGVLNLQGGIVLNGTEAVVDGSGTTDISGSVTGFGDLSVVTAYALLNSSPSFTGGIHVGGGVLVANVAVAQPISVVGLGQVRGPGTLTTLVLDGGTYFPGTGSTPTTVSVGDLTVNSGRVELSFGANNTPQSAINGSGNVSIAGGTLKLDLTAVPSIGTTFNALINSSGGHITGCFNRAIAPQPNIVFAVQCTTTAVSATVAALDRIFADGFDL